MGKRRRKIALSDRVKTLELIDETAVGAGARREKACGVLGITIRTAQRWRSSGSDMVEEDKRKNSPHLRIVKRPLKALPRPNVLLVQLSSERERGVLMTGQKKL